MCVYIHTIHTYIYIYIHTYTYTYTYIHTYKHTFIHTYKHMYILMMHTYIYMLRVCPVVQLIFGPPPV